MEENKEKIEVFKTIETVDIEGHKLEIHLGTFIEAERLFSECINYYKQEISGIDLITKEPIKEALLPLLKKCFFDGKPIKGWEFFENIENRPYYVSICLNVINTNNAPFMKSPL